MENTIVRVICAALAVVFGALIFLRRRGQKTE
jgi:hypothetical protein